MTDLTLRLTPSGALLCEGAAESAQLRAIAAAFERSVGEGLLHLGAHEVHTALPPSLDYFRRLAHHLVATSAGRQNPLATDTVTEVAPDSAWIAEHADRVPPMVGAEYVSAEVLAELWGTAQDALIATAGATPDGVRGVLASAHPSWHTAERVCLHLAENKKDPLYPFAFVATYARHAAGRSTLSYVPLRRALQEFAGEGNRDKLLDLLAPLQRAAEKSEVLQRLTSSGDVYHALAWTPSEAHALLKDAAVFEETGLVLRLPDWWRSPSRRARVQVSLGDDKPTAVGVGAMLSFDVGVVVDGEPLTDDEVRTLLAAGEGLVFIKGRWVEADPERLSEVLAHWRRVQVEVADGVSFAEAMRLLAGVPAGGEDVFEEGERAAWSEVVAGEWLRSRLEALRAPTDPSGIETRVGLRATLRPYQRTGVGWMSVLYQLGLGGVLADDMGLGKTIQVITHLAGLKADAVEGIDLLVVPASLVDNWVAELERFAPQLDVLVAHPSRIPARKLKALTSDALGGHDVVITTYGTLTRTPWMTEHAWRCLVLDEAQAIKNPGTKQTRATKQVKARWRLALTGTPVENRLGDLWSIFDFLNPGLLGSAKAFSEVSKHMRQRGEFGPLRRLVSPYVLRRMKTDKRVIADLPDKTEVTARCLLTRKQAALYKQAVEDLERTLEETAGIERRGAVLAYLMRFKQICNHPSQWLGDDHFKVKESGKFQRLAELCEPIAERQEKVLVFTQFRTMTEPLRAHLEEVFGHPGEVLHGGTPVRQRQELVDAFQTDPRVPFMVLSLKAGGTGLNLTAANHVIHFDRWWNPAVENQATDRAYRIGQKRNVLVHKFVVQGTIEERIDEMIQQKQALSDEVLGGEATQSLTELSNKELMALVQLDLQTAVTT